MHTVVIFGGSGFLGRHVTKELLETNYKIHSLGSRECDMMYQSDIDDILDDLQPTVIINLAAVVGGIGANQASPWDFYYKNITISNNLFCSAIKMDKNPLVIQIGTICSVAKNAKIPFNEEEFWDYGYPEISNAPYGIAKKATLVGLGAAHKQHGLEYVYLTPSNLYGPGDHFNGEGNHVIPALIKKFSTQNEVTLWGDGSATRDFLYVEDCAEAIAMCIENKSVRQHHINLGSEREISIKELSQKIGELTNFKGSVNWDTSKPNGQPRRLVDITRAKTLLGWSPKTTLEEGLAKTVEWFKRYES